MGLFAKRAAHRASCGAAATRTAEDCAEELLRTLSPWLRNIVQGESCRERREAFLAAAHALGREMHLFKGSAENLSALQAAVSAYAKAYADVLALIKEIAEAGRGGPQ